MSLALLVLAAATAAPHVAVPHFTVRGLEPEPAATLERSFGEALALGGGLEVSAAKMSCADERPCLDELAGLGIDWAVFGTVAADDQGTVVNLRLVATRTGELRQEWLARAGSDEAVLGFLDDTAERVRGLLVTAPPPRRTSFFRFVPVIMGGVALAGGIALWGWAWSEHRRLVTDPTIDTPERVEEVTERSRSIETTSYLLGGVGLGLIAAGLLFALFAPESDVRVGAAWVDGPALAVTLQGW